MRQHIKNMKPDVIFSFGYYVNEYAIMAVIGTKTRLIISERTDPESEPHNKFLKGIRNYLYNHCDTLVCQTHQAKDYFEKRCHAQMVVIPNPIKSDLPEVYYGDRKPIIVSACRLEKEKNLHMMIEAFSEVSSGHPDYKLIIYGEGALKEDLEKLISKKNLRDKVELPGFEKKIHEKIKDCAMYVSSSDYEGISNSMLEAMGTGLPVICTDCPAGGAGLAIKNGINGTLVPVGNEKKLAGAMENYILDPELAKLHGRNAVEVRERFRVDKIADQWLQLCEM